ncbi:uncharacterized protein [Clytia hemisphaerica]|uniref:Cnidarian restricted protein n=1 Tax=Clytia hemisphaerica TaxID=252671 RepID=A0A7M5XH79_9CNID
MGMIKVILMIAIVTLVINESDACFTHVGPGGLRQCIKFNTYSQYQWATCLTNEEVLERSKGKHWCTRSPTSGVKYCWYQCEVEKYGKNSGSVSSDCRCNIYQQPAVKQLADWCSKDNDTGCHWYDQCIGKYLNCENTATERDIAFNKALCKLTDNHFTRKQELSSSAKDWLNNTKKCLKSQYLNDHIKADKLIECGGIHIHTVNLQMCCLLGLPGCHQGTKAVSMCDLPWRELWRIATELGESFNGFNEGFHAFSTVTFTSTHCKNPEKHFEYTKVIEVVLLPSANHNRGKDETDDMIGYRVGQELIQSFYDNPLRTRDDRDRDLVFYPFFSPKESSSSKTVVKIFLFDKANLEADNPLTPHTVRLTPITQKFIDEFKNGSISIKTKTLWPTKASICIDYQCNGRSVTVENSNKAPDSFYVASGDFSFKINYFTILFMIFMTKLFII